jgi:hypothetical protein
MVQANMCVLPVVSMHGWANRHRTNIATYLFLRLLPVIIFKLTFLAILRNPTLLQTLVNTISKNTAWHLWGHAHSVCCKRVKIYKKPIRVDQETDKIMSKMRRYLLPLIFAAFKVGRCNKLHLQCFLHPYSRDPHLLALHSATTQLGEPPPV